MSVYSRVSNADAESLEAINGISLSRIAAINASVSSAFALLLNENYGEGAVAAYSVRRINALHFEGSMVVRRDSDDDFIVIGFDSNNNLDVSAIEVFCGTANGYVLSWLDQSGNKNSASQPSLTAQPKIYDSVTGVVKENGKPSLRFDGSQVLESQSVPSMNNVPLSIYNTVIADTTNNGSFVTTGFANNQITDTIWAHIIAGGGHYAELKTNPGNSVKSVNTGVAPTDFALISINADKNLDVWQNGISIGSNSLTGFTSGAVTKTILIGDSHSNARKLTGNVSESIIYGSSKSTADRTNIESNIGDYFSQNTPLLDTYTGSSGAYSLRLLRDAYKGPLIRVREDGNDSLLDIYPNLFGELDTAALAAHCGSRNGLVTGWYDQSGNLMDALQSSATAQPKIYDAVTGLIVDANGKPAMQFDGSNHYLDARYLGLSQPITASMVAKVDDANINYFFDGDDVTNRVSIFQNSSSFGFTPFAGASLPSNVKNTNNNLHFALYNGTSSAYHLNGNSVASGNAGTNIADGIIIASRYNIDGNKLDGTMQELVFWESNQSVNREGIEGNINSYYDIYDTGLIGEYSGAAAAYSLRSLSSLYDGAAITVRRDSDDSTKNIYFDSNGNLDTADLIGFCANNNGYAIRWFDQSGNANHGIQTAEAAQPKIYDSVTGIYYENGTPSLRFERVSDSVGDTLFTPAQQWIGAGDSVSSVIVTNKYQTPYGSSSLFSSNGSGTNRSFQWASTSSPAKIVFVANGSTNAASPDFSFHDLNIRAAYMSSATVEGYESGVDLGSGTAGSGLYNPSIEIYMGARYGAGEGHYFGMFKEFILWDSYLGADKVDIDQKINEHYLIYQPDTAPTSGLLATYSGASAAYSLRQLSNEAVIAVTVRRDSDDNVSPIGFKGGVIDTSALAAWCGNSNGYVTTWWDQSTLGNHATQSSFTVQPKIYDGNTGVVTENGKPALFFEADIMNFTLPSMTEGEVYRVLRAANDPSTSTSEAGGDVLGTGWNSGANSHYPWTNGTIYDSTGRTARLSFNPTANLAQQHLLNILSSSTEWTARINGTQEHTTSSNTVGFRTSNSFGQTGASLLKHHYQEFVIWPSDQSANRTGIETNILEFYTQYILDQYSGAAAAYSLRALSSTATNAVQVRRDSDDATQYIGFVQDGFSLSLDTSALSTFCGSANGYVSEWVDQSGSGNHATQPAFTAQPKIYDSSTGVITNNNGNLAVKFTRTSSTSLSTPAFDMIDTGWFCVTVAERLSATGDQKYIDSFGGLTDRTGVIFQHAAAGLTTMQATSSGGGGATVTGSISSNVTYLWTSENTLSNLNLYINGSSAGTASITSQGDDANGFTIGARKGGAQAFSDTYSSEIIYYRTDQSSNRTNIEDNINGYYDIY